MPIGQWFNEGAAAQNAGEKRDACPYPDGEARSEWFAGFDEALHFNAANAANQAKRLGLASANSNKQGR